MATTQTSYSVPSSAVSLSSAKTSYTIRLTGAESVVPENHDIVGIRLEPWESNEELEELRVWMGGCLVARFDATDKHALSTFPVYLTKLRYYSANLECVYSQQWLMEREKFEILHEYIEEEDTYCCFLLKRTTKRPTGNTVRRITEGVDVHLPVLHFTVQPGNPAETGYLAVPVRQRINLKGLGDDYLELLKSKHELCILDDHTTPYGYVTNHIQYINGMAGLKHALPYQKKTSTTPPPKPQRCLQIST